MLIFYALLLFQLTQICLFTHRLSNRRDSSISGASNASPLIAPQSGGTRTSSEDRRIDSDPSRGSKSRANLTRIRTGSTSSHSNLRARNRGNGLPALSNAGQVAWRVLHRRRNIPKVAYLRISGKVLSVSFPGLSALQYQSPLRFPLSNHRCGRIWQMA